jgi:hypothetical protein
MGRRELSRGVGSAALWRVRPAMAQHQGGMRQGSPQHALGFCRASTACEGVQQQKGAPNRLIKSGLRRAARECAEPDRRGLGRLVEGSWHLGREPRCAQCLRCWWQHDMPVLQQAERTGQPCRSLRIVRVWLQIQRYPHHADRGADLDHVPVRIGSPHGLGSQGGKTVQHEHQHGQPCGETSG